MRITCTVCTACCVWVLLLSSLNMINASDFYNNPSKEAWLWNPLCEVWRGYQPAQGDMVGLDTKPGGKPAVPAQDNTLDSCTTEATVSRNPCLWAWSRYWQPAALGPSLHVHLRPWQEGASCPGSCWQWKPAWVWNNLSGSVPKIISVC